MKQSETGSTLVKLRKMIESMQKEEMFQVQLMNADALAQIVSIDLPPFAIPLISWKSGLRLI
jgi:hypothetical protein